MSEAQRLREQIKTHLYVDARGDIGALVDRLVSIAQQADGGTAGVRRAWFADTPSHFPAPQDGAPAAEVVELRDYKALCDLWDEANALGTVLGSQERLMLKIKRLRDDFGARQIASQGAEGRQPLSEGVVISGYRIGSGTKAIRVERAGQMEGPDKWAIRQLGNCLNSDGEWEWEPMPSGREDDFLARCRFDTAEDAIARALLSESTTGGKSHE